MDVRELAVTAAKHCKAKDKAGWIGLFADDGFIQDPVGPYRWDPEGKGFHGKAGLSHFWDIAIALNRDIDFEVQREFRCGNELARVMILHIFASDGTSYRLPAVVCYRDNDAGKLASLRAYWEDAQAILD